MALTAIPVGFVAGLFGIGGIALKLGLGPKQKLTNNYKEKRSGDDR